MLKPLTKDDDLFPWILETVDGKEIAVAKKADWSLEKDVDLAIRTIDYLLQFLKHHGSKSLINMIAGVGDARQSERKRGTDAPI